jgi:hypothetical protein
MKCFDCPELDGGRMPPGWAPRPFCCNSEEARAEAREGEARERARSTPANDQPNRAARRRLARQKRKNPNA